MATSPKPIDRLFTPVVRDILLPVGLIVLDWTSLAARPAFLGAGPGPKPPSGPSPSPAHGAIAGPAAYALVACTFLPLALRRRFPLSVLGFTTAAAAVYHLLHLPPSLVFLAPLIALYTIGTLRTAERYSYRERWRSV